VEEGGRYGGVIDRHAGENVPGIREFLGKYLTETLEHVKQRRVKHAGGVLPSVDRPVHASNGKVLN